MQQAIGVVAAQCVQLLAALRTVEPKLDPLSEDHVPVGLTQQLGTDGVERLRPSPRVPPSSNRTDPGRTVPPSIAASNAREVRRAASTSSIPIMSPQAKSSRSGGSIPEARNAFLNASKPSVGWTWHRRRGSPVSVGSDTPLRSEPRPLAPGPSPATPNDLGDFFERPRPLVRQLVPDQPLNRGKTNLVEPAGGLHPPHRPLRPRAPTRGHRQRSSSTAERTRSLVIWRAGYRPELVSKSAPRLRNSGTSARHLASYS